MESATASLTHFGYPAARNRSSGERSTDKRPADWFPVRATSSQSPVCQIRELVTHSLNATRRRGSCHCGEKPSLPCHSQGRAKLVTARRAVQSQMVSIPGVLPAASQRPSGDRATPQWLLPNAGQVFRNPDRPGIPERE